MGQERNDKRIREFLDKVEALKKEVDNKPRYTLETNGALVIDGVVVNLNTIQNVDKIINALAALTMQKQTREAAAKELGIDDYEFKQDGYTYDQWVSDLKMRVGEVQRQAKKKHLEKLEKTLSQLVSEEERTAMELDKIADLLS